MKAAPLSKKQEKSLCLLIVLSALDVGKEAAPQLEKIGPLQYRAKGSDVLFTPYMDYPKGEIYRAYFRYGGKA